MSPLRYPLGKARIRKGSITARRDVFVGRGLAPAVPKEGNIIFARGVEDVAPYNNVAKLLDAVLPSPQGNGARGVASVG